MSFESVLKRRISRRSPRHFLGEELWQRRRRPPRRRVRPRRRLPRRRPRRRRSSLRGGRPVMTASTSPESCLRAARGARWPNAVATCDPLATTRQNRPPFHLAGGSIFAPPNWRQAAAPTQSQAVAGAGFRRNRPNCLTGAPASASRNSVPGCLPGDAAALAAL